METIELKLIDFYELNALIFGVKDMIKGFINEIHPELKESVKRKVFKIGNTIKLELSQIEEQRQQILKTEDSNEIKSKKIEELLASTETFQVDKPLFSFIENVSLSANYQFLYEKIFKD